VANLSLVQLPVVQRSFGFAKGWPDVEFVVPPGWDADAAARLVKEYETDQAKNNPMAKLMGASQDSSNKPGDADADNLNSGVISFTGLQQQKAPPPPASTEADAEGGTASGPKLHKVRGDKARKHSAKTQAGGNKRGGKRRRK
jgi:hypothetical protein